MATHRAKVKGARAPWMDRIWVYRGECACGWKSSSFFFAWLIEGAVQIAQHHAKTRHTGAIA